MGPDVKKKKSRAGPRDPVLRALLRLLVRLASLILVLVLVFTFVFGLYRVKDAYMVPNVNPGDLILYYRLDKKYIVGDVVAYHYKGQVKLARVVALAGDTVDIDERGLKVNGAHQYEQKIYKETQPLVEGIKFPVKLGNKEVFVLADNRDKGVDSRLFGPLKTKDVSGKIFTLVRRRDM